MKKENEITLIASGLIAFIRNALHGDMAETAITDADEAHDIIEYATQQGLLMFLNEYASFREILRGKQYFKRTMADVYLRTHQAEELKKLLDAFEENEISCVVLKGARSRELYPKPEWRSMGDIDLLYLPKQTKQVQQVMKSLGYQGEGSKVRHDEYQKGPVVVEMHRTLCVPEWKESQYFENVWNRTQARGDYQYIFDMTPEEHYLYTFTHLVEHFVTGGIGIRMVLDIYVLSQLGNMDWDYIERVLKKLGYNVFHEKIRMLANAWFDADSERNVPEELQELESYVIAGGIFGTWQNESVNRQLQYQGKLHYFKTILFPDYKTMQTVYPWLHKKLFLPTAWVLRWFQVLLHRRKNVTVQMKRMQSFQEENEDLGKRRAFFEEMGL